MDPGPSTKRLHVGGLTPSITPAHIKDRFASFGRVHDVEALQPDALGRPRPFTFLTIDITPPQLKKCMNIMSGSMWRGTQLRIAEAKPNYEARLQKERNPPVEDSIVRAQKRRRRNRKINEAAGTGKEAQDMREPSLANYTSKKFWTLTPSQHLIRPIAIRPSHPLPPLPSSSSKSPASRPRAAPSRQRRKVINPALWGPTHLAVDSLLGDPSQVDIGEEWEWDSVQEDVLEEDDEDQITIGRWVKRVDGSVVDEQVVKGRKRHLDLMDLEEEYEVSGSEAGSDLFGRRNEQVDEMDDSGSELFGRRDGEARETSPLFGSRPDAKGGSADMENTLEELNSSKLALEDETVSITGSSIAESTANGSSSSAENPIPEPINTDNNDRSSEDQASQTPRSRSASPLFPARAPSLPSKVTNVPQAEPAKSTRKTVVSIPDPLKKQVLEEQSRDLSLLDSILGGGVKTAETRVKEPEWTVYEESDDDEEIYTALRLRGGAPDEDQGETYKPLRLRGGAATSGSEDEDENMESESDSGSSDSSSSSSSGSSSSNSESDDDSDTEMPETTAYKSAEPVLNGDAIVPNPAKPTGLKDMFASSNKTGFSLFADLDPDLELDELDVPLAPNLRAPEAELQPLEELQPGATVSGLFNPDPSIPLFFPPSKQSGKRAENDAFSAERESEGWKEFWRQENEDEMKEIWRRDKLGLTREWKQRHREAKKSRRRRGGVDEVE